jgi:dipeptidyl-peptidase-4
LARKVKTARGDLQLGFGQNRFHQTTWQRDDYLTNLSWTPDEKFVLIAELNRGQMI